MDLSKKKCIPCEGGIAQLDKKEVEEYKKQIKAGWGVTNLELLKQTSPKNKFDFGLSMEFATANEYEDYNGHPDHVRFVETFWKTEVSDFLELDYEPLN